MPTEKKKILEFKQYTKSDKMSYVIYADIESLIRKKGGCVTNPQKYSTTKTGEHIPWGYLMWTISVFDHIEKIVWKIVRLFCDSLRERTKNIIAFQKKKMLPLTKEELITYQYTEVCYIWGRKTLK